MEALDQNISSRPSSIVGIPCLGHLHGIVSLAVALVETTVRNGKWGIHVSGWVHGGLDPRAVWVIMVITEIFF